MIRHRVADWLTTLDWPEEAFQDIVLAVNEAVANVVDHAYPDMAPGIVRVQGRMLVEPNSTGIAVLRRVELRVVDRGAWDVDHRAVDPRGFRGHGLAVMAACVDRVDLHRDDKGTTVELLSHPIRSGEDAEGR